MADGRANADRPLTDAQERTLILLDDYADRYGPAAYTKPQGVQEPTLEVLHVLGLVDLQQRPTTAVARINAAGREMLASMGD